LPPLPYNNTRGGAMSRRQFTAEEKTQIVLEGLTTSITIAELCRKHSIYETQYYKWREEFVEAGRQRFESSGSNDIVKAKENKNRQTQRAGR